MIPQTPNPTRSILKSFKLGYYFTGQKMTNTVKCLNIVERKFEKTNFITARQSENMYNSILK